MYSRCGTANNCRMSHRNKRKQPPRCSVENVNLVIRWCKDEKTIKVCKVSRDHLVITFGCSKDISTYEDWCDDYNLW